MSSVNSCEFLNSSKSLILYIVKKHQKLIKVIFLNNTVFIRHVHAPGGRWVESGC